MIDRTNAISTVLARLKKLPVGHCLDMRTYKRNRSVLMVRTGEDAFLVTEDGYRQETFEGVTLARMKKLLGTLLRLEFPRSTKIRLYDLGEYDPATLSHDRRKVI